MLDSNLYFFFGPLLAIGAFGASFLRLPPFLDITFSSLAAQRLCTLRILP
jgi:hypothetical protein